MTNKIPLILETINICKRENIVWNKLKEFFKKEGYHHGVYEEQKEIEAQFNIKDNEIKSFIYRVSKQESQLFATTNIINKYPEDSVTDIFILTSHLNSILKNGKIILDPQKSTVTLMNKISLIDCVYDHRFIYEMICRHIEYSKDIDWAFKKLIVEKEEPVFIIDEIIKSKEKSNH